MVEVVGSASQEWDCQDGSTLANGNRHDESTLANGVHVRHDHSSSEQHQIGNKAGDMIGSPDELAKPSLLGLPLEKTPQLINLTLEVSQRNSIQGKQLRIGGQEKGKKPKHEKDHAWKPKAKSCEGYFVRIGSWERLSKNGGDLVFKFYFASKKLVWEIMEDSLKRKIEFPWSTITAIRASFEKLSVLEVELKEPPQFFLENPQPRRPTLWKITNDFTECQASTYRWHRLEFADRSFDEEDYEELLRYDARFLQMSRQPFPSSSSPLFEKSLHEPRSLLDTSTLAGNWVLSQNSDFINPLPLNSLGQNMCLLNSSMGAAYSDPLLSQSSGLESLNTYVGSTCSDPFLMQTIGFSGGNPQISALNGSCSEANGYPYVSNANYVPPVFPTFGEDGISSIQHERNPSWNEGLVNPSTANFGMEHQVAGIPTFLNYADQETNFIPQQVLADDLLLSYANVHEHQNVQYAENNLFMDQHGSSFSGDFANELGSGLQSSDIHGWYPGNNQGEANTLYQQNNSSQQQGGFDPNLFMG